MSRAIDILKHEHEAILAALNILDSLAQQMNAEQAVDADDLYALLAVFKDFAELCHHAKEEDLLLPSLVKAGLAAEGGPLAALLKEHAEARRLFRAIEIAAQPPLGCQEFSLAAQAYSQHLRDHIAQEDRTLFPMAERVLSPAQLNALADAFDEHEVKAIGPGRHDEMSKTIVRLRKRYLM